MWKTSDPLRDGGTDTPTLHSNDIMEIQTQFITMFNINVDLLGKSATFTRSNNGLWINQRSINGRFTRN